MSIPRKIGILIFCAVPAIVGGGVVFDIFNGSYTHVFFYEAVLALFAGNYLAR